MHAFKTLVTVLVATVCLFSCSQQDKTPQQFIYGEDPAQFGVTPERIAALDSVLQSFVADRKVPCVTAFVAKGGHVVYEKSFGIKNLETGAPARTDDIYVLFSQTKAIVAVALMTLYEQGLVGIEDPISKWIPGFSEEVLTEVNDDGTYKTVPADRPVRVGDLLCHSSGYMAPLTNKLARLQGEGGMRGAPRTTVGASVEANKVRPLGFQPGTDWNYNVDMDVIAYLIEIVSGKTLQEYLKEVIFTPLGMDHTAYYYDDPSLRDRIVTTYSKADGEFVTSPWSSLDSVFEGPKTYAGGTFGLYGPIEDYAKFCQMLMNGGEFNGHRILHPETIALMTTNRLPEVNSGGEGFQFGLGFELFGNDIRKNVPAMSSRCFRWGGAAGTEYLMDPENDLVMLYYISMWGATHTYDDYLKAAYGLFGL